MAVWFNSSPGVVAVLSSASPRCFSRPDLSLTAIRSIRVPDLSTRQQTSLAEVLMHTQILAYVL